MAHGPANTNNESPPDFKYASVSDFVTTFLLAILHICVSGRANSFDQNVVYQLHMLRKSTIIWTILFLASLPAMGRAYLSGFTVSEVDGNVVVNWTTRAGFTCEDINVLYGTDSTELSSVYTYPGICGSDTSEESYTFIMREPDVNQDIFFQIDLGVFGKSEILHLRITQIGTSGSLVYPNPASSQSTLLFDNPNADVSEITVYSGAGSQIYSYKTRNRSVTLAELNLEHSGLYSYTILVDGRILRGKFVLL